MHPTILGYLMDDFVSATAVWSPKSRPGRAAERKLRD